MNKQELKDTVIDTLNNKAFDSIQQMEQDYKYSMDDPVDVKEEPVTEEVANLLKEASYQVGRFYIVRGGLGSYSSKINIDDKAYRTQEEAIKRAGRTDDVVRVSSDMDSITFYRVFWER